MDLTTNVFEIVGGVAQSRGGHEHLFGSLSLPPRLDLPLYKRLAEAIRERVRSGELRPGDRLPTKAEIAASARVSIDTVARAVSVLVKERILIGGSGDRLRVLQTDGPSEEPRKTRDSSQELQGAVDSIQEVDGAIEVRVCLPDGQSLTVATTAAAIDWLNLRPGAGVVLGIKTSAMILTGPSTKLAILTKEASATGEGTDPSQ